MRFVEAYGEWNAGRLTQAEAGLVLGMCERSFRRYVSRYEADGWEGLVDQRLEQVSNRRAPVHGQRRRCVRARSLASGHNAMAESFFASLECELLDRKVLKTRI